MIITWLLIILLAVLLYLRKYSYGLFYEKLPHFPQHLLAGNLLLLKQMSPTVLLARARAILGDKFAMYAGPFRIICLSRIDHIEQVFQRRHIYERDSFSISIMKIFLPNSFRTLTGNEWKMRKKILTQIFRAPPMANYISSIVSGADELIEYWHTEKNVADNSGRLKPVTKKVIFDIFLKLLLVDPSIHKESSPEFREVFFEYENYIKRSMRAIFVPYWLAKIYLKLNKSFQRTESILRSYIDQFMKDANKNQSNLMTALIDAEEKKLITKDNVFADCVDFLSTAYGLGELSIAWFFHYVANNQQIQINIKKELASFGITAKSSLTIEQINQLVYLESVVKEILRHSTAITPYTAREALQDDYLGNDQENIYIRKGDTVVICTYNLHHDRGYWKADPNEFLPERFFNEDKDHEPFAYTPFGGGHRICTGQKLGWLEFKLFILRLMQFVTVHKDNHEVKVNPDLGQEEFVNLNGIYVTFDNGKTL